MHSPPQKTILIVDDDRAIAEIIEQILLESGFACRIASHGGEALENIKEFGLPDLIVLDWMMPMVSGEEFLTELRRKEPKLPVVVISALDLRRHRVAAQAVLQKPFEFRELLRVIERCIAEPE